MSKSTTKSRHVSHVAHHASETADNLKGLVHEAKSALSTAGDQATDKIQVLRERLQEGLTGFRTRVKVISKVVKRQAARADHTIRANPYQSLGVAAGAGFVAGYLISRRRSD
jgi:ElaB/YqjD/DUF883 family membrane-anchored ribosome-binding protein